MASYDFYVDKVTIDNIGIHPRTSARSTFSFSGADTTPCLNFTILLNQIAWWVEDVENAYVHLHLIEGSKITLIFDPTKFGSPPDGGQGWADFVTGLFTAFEQEAT